MRGICRIQVECQEGGYDFHSIPGSKPSHQKLHISLYRIEAQAKSVRDLFVAEASDKQPDNLLFPAVEIELPSSLHKVHAVWVHPLQKEKV